MMKKAVLTVVVLALLGAGWFFVSPLFIDREVDESFDFVLDDGSVSVDRVMAMPEDERMAMQDDIMSAAAAMEDKTMSEPMRSSETSLLATGRFVDADAIHKGEGVAKLYAVPGDLHIVRFEDFRTTNGPALYVYLARHPNPTTAAHVEEAGFLNLGKLKGNVGNQNYEIPLGTDVSEYGSVVIWCELFGVLFSPASLTST